MKKIISLCFLLSAITGFCAGELLIIRPRIYYSGESGKVEVLNSTKGKVEE